LAAAIGALAHRFSCGGIVEEHHPEAGEQQVKFGPENSLRCVGLDKGQVCPPLSAVLGQTQHFFRNIKPRDAAFWPHRFGQRHAGGAGAAANVQHRLAPSRRGKRHQGLMDRGQIGIHPFLQHDPFMSHPAIPEINLVLAGGHGDQPFAFRLRMASVRRRKAFSLMKPWASFWS
jgi:hypothetical protein